MKDHTNIVRIKAVNRALANIGQEFVFVGGAVVSLYAVRLFRCMRIELQKKYGQPKM